MRIISLSKNIYNTCLVVILVATSVAAFGSGIVIPDEYNQWPSGGGNIHNTRAAVSEKSINSKTVGDLQLKWQYTTKGDVTATPAVDDSGVYFPDGGGYLTKLNAADGQLLWQTKISDYTGNTKTLSLSEPVSRSTPAIYAKWLVIGTRDGFVLGIDKNDGKLIWKTRADDHPATMITMSPLIYSNVVYVGVSSTEAAIAADPAYKCCTFRGSALALDLATGKILWRIYSVPEGFSGAPMWGGTPAVDEKRRLVYFTTGQNYSLPDTVRDCIKNAKDNQSASKCSPVENRFDSVVAIDLDKGQIKWAVQAEPYDVWTLGCGVPEYGIPRSGNCELPQSPDYDFASGVNLYSLRKDDMSNVDVVGAGQKSGTYWALNPDTGKVVWSTKVGPGGVIGGIMWGSAVSNGRIYIGITNSMGAAYALKGAKQDINWGAWSGLSAETGEIEWQTADPTPGGKAMGFVSATADVVFAASFDNRGHYYAMDANTGKILWQFKSGGSTISGPAIVNGNVYWGSGYRSLGGTGNDKIHAFGLPKTTNGINKK